MSGSMYLQSDRSALPCEPPTDGCVRACERRVMLITPDRRSFIQSMSHECARRISGNSVPAHADRNVFAYSFPTQYYAQSASSIPSSSRYHSGIMGTGNGTPSRIRDDAHNVSSARRRYQQEEEEIAYGTPFSQRNGPATDASSDRRRRGGNEMGSARRSNGN